MALMRSTLHLVSAPDALQLRPWLRNVMESSRVFTANGIILKMLFLIYDSMQKSHGFIGFFIEAWNFGMLWNVV